MNTLDFSNTLAVSRAAPDRSTNFVALKLIEEVGEAARAANQPERCDEPLVGELADILLCLVDFCYLNDDPSMQGVSDMILMFCKNLNPDVSTSNVGGPNVLDVYPMSLTDVLTDLEVNDSSHILNISAATTSIAVANHLGDTEDLLYSIIASFVSVIIVYYSYYSTDVTLLQEQIDKKTAKWAKQVGVVL